MYQCLLLHQQMHKKYYKINIKIKIDPIFEVVCTVHHIAMC